MIAAAGMPAWKWLTCTDPFERMVIERVAQRRHSIAADEREDLAGRIVSTLGKALKKK